MIRALFAALALAASCGAARAATDIALWHSLNGAAAFEIERIADEFNAAQSQYRVVPLYKGNAREALDAGLAAQRTGTGPHLVQVDESLTSAVSDAPKAFLPLFQVMAEAKEPFKTATYVPLLEERFMDERGRLTSLPFNASTPVLYYNRTVFAAAKLDPDRGPQTWQDVQAAALAVLDERAADCGYTTDSPAWVHVENVLALHNEPLAEGQGPATRLVLNTRLPILHVGMMSSWVSSGLFTFSASAEEAERNFTSGRCAIMTGPSSAVADIERKANFAVGVAPLPVHADFVANEGNLVPAGGSLWVMSGHKKPEYAGVAKFVSFFSRPEVQAQWHQTTGYLANTVAGYELTQQNGFYMRHPGAEVPMKGVMRHAPARRMRLHSSTWLRPILDQELAAVWGKREKTPKEALDDAVERGNKLLKSMMMPQRRMR